MTTHTCIKPGCAIQYEDKDVDPYYCPTCNAERKAIAAEIDKKMAARPSRRQSVSRFAPKDFVGKGGRIFFNANDIL